MKLSFGSILKNSPAGREAKPCSRCGLEKPLVEFYGDNAASDGKRNECKVCHNAYAKELYHRRKKGTNNQRPSAHPNGRKARIVFSNALQRGKVQRFPCWVCDSENAEAHHPNYDAPMDVIWLCHPHHMRTHAMVVTW